MLTCKGIFLKNTWKYLVLASTNKLPENYNRGGSWRDWISPKNFCIITARTNVILMCNVDKCVCNNSGL